MTFPDLLLAIITSVEWFGCDLVNALLSVRKGTKGRRIMFVNKEFIICFHLQAFLGVLAVCFLLLLHGNNPAIQSATITTTTGTTRTTTQPPFHHLTYKTFFYNNTLDHLAPFSPAARQTTFAHRYLVNDTYFGHPTTTTLPRLGNQRCPQGPIFLYTGNEGDITEFWNNNGFMHYLAVKYGGLVVFAEERYYGASVPPHMPLKNTSRHGLLTTQQVLEDYVELLSHVKSEYHAEHCPTIAFGGSYGGTLAAFLRYKYPFAIQGALASSSELGYYDRRAWQARGITEYTFAEIVARQYRNQSKACLELIWDAAELIDAMGNDDDDESSRQQVMQTFHFCNDSALLPHPSSTFIYALEGLPQQNYPYPVGHLPAWPVQVVCSILTNNTTSLLQRAARVTALVLGYELHDGPCLPTLEEGPGNIPGDGPGAGSWGYQSCTETMHQFSSVARNANHLGLRHFNYTEEADDLIRLCRDLYNVVPNTNSLAARYGGFDIAKTMSNTIFSAGALDPWGGAALMARAGGDKAVQRGVYFIWMQNAAHHLDLRGFHQADPPDVVAARLREESIIVGWIKDWFKSFVDDGDDNNDSPVVTQ